MNREQMIEKAAQAIAWEPSVHIPGALQLRLGESDDEIRAMAADVVDVLLPQVTTVEELEALPDYTMLLTMADDNAREGGPIPNAVLLVRGVLLTSVLGEDWERVPDWLRDRWLRRGPLTVVWRPS